MQAWSTACRWRRGEILGGEEGAALVAAAREQLERQQVVRPEGIVRMPLPGPLGQRQ